MSDDRMFERNAQAWLEAGPSMAPARVVQAALRIIETTPQQRDLRVSWRFPSLKVSPSLATAGVVAILVVAAGFLLLRNQPATVGGPSPSPTASLEPSPVSADTLRATWASVGWRPSPAYDSTLSISISFTGSNLHIGQLKYDVDSTWSLVDGGTRLSLTFTTNFTRASPQDPGRWDCQVGDAGTYDIRLSDDGTTLTLVPIGDVCAPRADMLSGSWTRWRCTSTYECNQVTRVDPGRYIASIFKPFNDGANGQFAYTLPTGWAFTGHPPTWPETEWNKRIDLLRAADIGAHSISLYSGALMRSQEAIPDSQPVSCATTAPLPFASPAAVADWLESLSGLQVTGRTAVTIGGLDGIMVDLALTPGWTNPCESSQQGSNGTEVFPVVFDGPRRLFHDPVVDDEEGLSVNIDDRARYILLDRGEAQVLLIRVQTRGKAGWDRLVAAAMPVIESFEFTR